MGLFDKKYCDVCGAKIGLLGNRKLEDGNLCKECAGKLSPWFSERRQSTVQEIKEQLAYREENREAVAAFHTTRTLGGRVKVLLDEDAGKFMVTSARNLAEANPDVLSFSDVTGCQLDIDESKTEIEYKDAEGKRQSFNPRSITHKLCNLRQFFFLSLKLCFFNCLKLIVTVSTLLCFCEDEMK